MGKIFWVIFLMAFFATSCGRKAPPPGKPDVDGPVLEIKGITQGDTISDTADLNVEASDKSGISFVALFVDGSEILRDSASPYNFTWDTGKLPDTLHVVVAKGLDTWDNWGVSPKIIVITRNGNKTNKEGEGNGK